MAELRSAPLAAVGFGEKAYLPCELVRGEQLVRGREAENRAAPPRRGARQTERPDLPPRHVLDPGAPLRGRGGRGPGNSAGGAGAAAAGGLLSRTARLQGYPECEWKTVAPLLSALAAHLDDASVYEDPWYHTAHNTTADWVLGAFVRIAETDAFTFVDPGERHFVSNTLRFPEAERAGLLEQVKRWSDPGRVTAGGSSPWRRPEQRRRVRRLRRATAYPVKVPLVDSELDQRLVCYAEPPEAAQHFLTTSRLEPLLPGRSEVDLTVTREAIMFSDPFMKTDAILEFAR